MSEFDYTREQVLQAIKVCTADHEYNPDCARCPLDAEKENHKLPYSNCIEHLLKAAARLIGGEEA